jgi:hypothetical protein
VRNAMAFEAAQHIACVISDDLLSLLSVHPLRPGLDLLPPGRMLPGAMTDRLDPAMSAAIVRSHVVEGIRMAEQARIFPWLRPSRLACRTNGAPAGKTAALYAGVRQAVGRWIAFMDADLQNDPRDLPKTLEVLRASGAALVQGNRCARRRDNWVRRASSRIAWACKWAVIRDQTQDSGCAYTVMTRD